ncbi:MAG: ABC transporter permease [Patescibacteria group bacterium]
MRISDILEETYSALSANKARSGLTVLGIVIGISSVIAMLSIGQGAQSSITASIQSIGSNLITVQPGAQRGPGMNVSAGRGSAKTLTLDDATAIVDSVASVKAVAPEVSGRYQITAKGQNTNVQVIGTVAAYSEVKNVSVDLGDFISDQNINSAARVAVIGPTVRDDIFSSGTDPIGQSIKINKVDFKIIGLTKTKGSSGFNNPDDMIYVPISTAQRLLSGNKYLSSINVEAETADSMTTVQTDITNLLLARHNISDATQADFNTQNQADILSTMSSVTSMLTLLLGSVAGISLIVGGIGIMNMMLTTVTERTKEIGLRKAIGAKSRDISIQFLIEAVMLTFLGGFIGIILGWAIAFGITYFGVMQTSVSTSSVFLAFGVSAVIGIVFGYYPARRAAKLNPIDALRFE